MASVSTTACGGIGNAWCGVAWHASWHDACVAAKLATYHAEATQTGLSQRGMAARTRNLRCDAAGRPRTHTAGTQVRRLAVPMRGAALQTPALR